ncbi:hypothetical protein ACPMCT_17265 [Clostridioides difficile]|uniref:hypothetical protein n=1 Tax=Clostridioides difficile TaxID=1496 RepID=UPI00038D39D2|nr:hypothetical protein [Clostridioides difficile]EQJ94793.1 hypothetical protein QUA_0948 [Clostridioides difficile P49]MBY1861069.1 hypothetical protein [Clostridioides difficile]MBZ0706796.1 hypothetical protein [Clostridioides difficile]MCH7327251.1 hypothetical protein [Clostridioides difficile]MCI4737402.1 hypothetical protein [Clostridioides difficile]
MIDIESVFVDLVSRGRKWSVGLYIEPETYERINEESDKEVNVSELLKVLNNK